MKTSLETWIRNKIKEVEENPDFDLVSTDVIKLWIDEYYETEQPVICPCCGSNKTYKTNAVHCNRCAVTTEI